MWFLNYCAPYIYQRPGEIETSRFVMYTCVMLLFLVYVVNIVLYKLMGKEVQLPRRYPEEPDNTRKYSITFKGIAEKEYRMHQKKFKEWYLHYFGIHTIAVGAAIMYSPYYEQLAFAVIHLILFVICTVLHSCNKKGAVRIAFNVMLTICALINILMLFTASMGVGASGYDPREKICFFNRRE